jgi:hypothetical protein
MFRVYFGHFRGFVFIFVILGSRGILFALVVSKVSRSFLGFFGCILVILRFWEYFSHFELFRGILVI